MPCDVDRSLAASEGDVIRRNQLTRLRQLGHAGIAEIGRYAIFVAHNVNFDYSFLACGFERLEKRFRFPKLSTVAGMRRRYPGHKSYSLRRPCELYEMELQDHHRALCDARAKTKLLTRINRRRDQAGMGERERATSVAARGKETQSPLLFPNYRDLVPN